MHANCCKLLSVFQKRKILPLFPFFRLLVCVCVCVRREASLSHTHTHTRGWGGWEHRPLCWRCCLIHLHRITPWLFLKILPFLFFPSMPFNYTSPCSPSFCCPSLSPPPPPAAAQPHRFQWLRFRWCWSSVGQLHLLHVPPAVHTKPLPPAERNVSVSVLVSQGPFTSHQGRCHVQAAK